MNAEVLWITDCTYVVSDDRLSHAGRSENRGLSICKVLTASLKHHSSSLERIRRRIQGKACSSSRTSAISESSEDTLSVSEEEEGDELLDEEGDCRAMGGPGSRLLTAASSPTFFLFFRVSFVMRVGEGGGDIQVH